MCYNKKMFLLEIKFKNLLEKVPFSSFPYVLSIWMPGINST